jgi:hypothetical protein
MHTLLGRSCTNCINEFSRQGCLLIAVKMGGHKKQHGLSRAYHGHDRAQKPPSLLGYPDSSRILPMGGGEAQKLFHLHLIGMPGCDGQD